MLITKQTFNALFNRSVSSILLNSVSLLHSVVFVHRSCRFRSSRQHVKAPQVEQLSVIAKADWWSSCCACECVRWHGYNWRLLVKLDSSRCYGDTGGLRRASKLLPRPHSCDFLPPPLLSFEPCPRAWRRGRTTGLTKSTRVSFAGMRRGSWGWSWRAAQRMDSSRLSASFSRPERSATAANSARMNSCWKSMIPRWPDSPPGTSTLWSNTAKTPSDSSVSNKVRLFPSFHTNFPAFLTFFFFGSGKPLAFWPAFVFWQQCYCLPLLRGSVDKPRK